MMPVVDMGQTGTVNYKQKYKTLKRKLRFLVYEQECFLEELRKTQRKLLKVSRDRSFLLDRLLQYEKIDDSSSDSDGTASSESDTEGHKDGGSNKKKKTPPVHSVNMFPGGDQAAMLNTMGFASMMAGHSNVLPQSAAKTPEPAKKKAKTNPKKSATKSASKSSKSGSKGTHKHDSGVGTVPMTREEVERHLESSQRNKPQFLSIEKVASDLPLDIFSNDNSNIDSDQVDGAHTEDGAEDHDLIIDLQ